MRARGGYCHSLLSCELHLCSIKRILRHHTKALRPFAPRVGARPGPGQSRTTAGRPTRLAQGPSGGGRALGGPRASPLLFAPRRLGAVPAKRRLSVVNCFNVFAAGRPGPRAGGGGSEGRRASGGRAPRARGVALCRGDGRHGWGRGGGAARFGGAPRPPFQVFPGPPGPLAAQGAARRSRPGAEGAGARPAHTWPPQVDGARGSGRPTRPAPRPPPVTGRPRPGPDANGAARRRRPRSGRGREARRRGVGRGGGRPRARARARRCRPCAGAAAAPGSDPPTSPPPPPPRPPTRPSPSPSPPPPLPRGAAAGVLEGRSKCFLTGCNLVLRRGVRSQLGPPLSGGACGQSAGPGRVGRPPSGW